MIEIARDVHYTQGHGCRLCVENRDMHSMPVVPILGRIHKGHEMTIDELAEKLAIHIKAGRGSMTVESRNRAGDWADIGPDEVVRHEYISRGTRVLKIGDVMDLGELE